MSVKQMSLVPLTYDLPVNVQINIEPLERDKGYQVRIIADDWDWCEFIIPLRREDVKNLNTKLQTAIDGVTVRFEKNDTDATEHSRALSELTERGRYAFNKIFTEGELRDTIRKVLKTCKTIQVTSNDFFIPWELLYDGPLGDQADVFCFWGMQYIISRNLIRAGNRDAFTPSPISPCPRVGMVADTKLSHVMEKEIPMLQNFEQQKKIHLSLLPELDPDQRQKELPTFSSFLCEELQVLHFACHADEEKIRSDPARVLSEAILSEPFLRVSNEFRIKMDDFEERDFKLRNKPLVILNACVTGTINPLCTSNWAVLFWKCGARGILATEFHVPDWFAAVFIEEVYNQLFSGKPIGEALLATRHYFWQWEEQRNPLGLAYALYSRLSIRIASSSN